MPNGYRGMTFEARAKGLGYNDWYGARDLMLAMGTAVDRLEAETFPVAEETKPVTELTDGQPDANEDN